MYVLVYLNIRRSSHNISFVNIISKKLRVPWKVFLHSLSTIKVAWNKSFVTFNFTAKTPKAALDITLQFCIMLQDKTRSISCVYRKSDLSATTVSDEIAVNYPLDFYPNYKARNNKYWVYSEKIYSVNNGCYHIRITTKKVYEASMAPAAVFP